MKKNNIEEGKQPSSLLWNTEQTAAHIGVKPVTVRSWRQSGAGPKYFKPAGSRIVRYRPEDVQAWLEQNMRTSISAPAGKAGAK